MMFSEITLHQGIDLTNLPCLTSVLPGDTSDSGNSSSSRYYVLEKADICHLYRVYLSHCILVYCTSMEHSFSFLKFYMKVSSP